MNGYIASYAPGVEILILLICRILPLWLSPVQCGAFRLTYSGASVIGK